MIKGNRKSTRAKTTGKAASDVSHPDGSLQYSSALPDKKLHLYDVSAVLQQQKSEETRESCLVNGSTVVLTDPILKDKSRKDFPKDLTDFGLFPKKQNSLNSNKIYSLAEEAKESDSDILDWVREETVEKPLAEDAEQEENESSAWWKKRKVCWRTKRKSTLLISTWTLDKQTLIPFVSKDYLNLKFSWRTLSEMKQYPF